MYISCICICNIFDKSCIREVSVFGNEIPFCSANLNQSWDLFNSQVKHGQALSLHFLRCYLTPLIFVHFWICFIPFFWGGGGGLSFMVNLVKIKVKSFLWKLL